MRRITLQLRERYFDLAKIESKFTCKEPRNNFIKASIKTVFPVGNGNVKIDDREYTLHPSKTQVNTKTKSKVGLNDGHNPPRYNPSYPTLYPDIGYENCVTSLLVIKQSSNQCGFMAKPYSEQCPKTDHLSLDIEYDDPFWFGIMFSKKEEEELQDAMEKKTIHNFQILETEHGSIIVAVRRLIPEWERFGLSKDRSVLGHYTEHENFIVRNE